jgi:hypothetical protein
MMHVWLRVRLTSAGALYVNEELGMVSTEVIVLEFAPTRESREGAAVERAAASHTAQQSGAPVRRPTGIERGLCADFAKAIEVELAHERAKVPVLEEVGKKLREAIHILPESHRPIMVSLLVSHTLITNESPSSDQQHTSSEFAVGASGAWQELII